MNDEARVLDPVRMSDQHGDAVQLDVRQDGGLLGVVQHGKRVRIKIRARALAYRVERVVLGDAENWHVYDVRVGTRSQIVSLGESPEDDGIPGAIFSRDVPDSFLYLETVQKDMDLVFEVAYRGPSMGGEVIDLSMTCVAAYEGDDPGSLDPEPREFVEDWGSLMDR